MDVSRILEELKAELQQVEAVLLSLERLALGRGMVLGRPPIWMADVTPPPESNEP